MGDTAYLLRHEQCRLDGLPARRANWDALRKWIANATATRRSKRGSVQNFHTTAKR